MTNADVIQLVKAGLSEQVVITSIRQAPSRNFDLTSTGLIALKKARVPDAVILVMQNPGKRDTSVKPASPTGLSRQKAAELISRQQNLPATQAIAFGRHIKRSWSDPAGSGFMPPVTLCVVQGGETYSAVQQRLADWQSKGLVSIGEAQEHQGKCNYLWATTQVTGEGSKYLVSQDVQNGVFSFKVKTYDLAFGEITGIQINEQFKFAEADYTLKKINITPFAGDISLELINRTATFVLFDDGWRIK